MKKTAALLAAALVGTAAGVPFVPSRKSPLAHSDSPLLALRGGDLGPIPASNLALAFGTLAVGDAVAGTIKPVDAWDKFGIKVEPGSKGEFYLGHGLAVSAASLAVTSLLAVTGKASVEEAIGYGFLTRCAYMTEGLLGHKYEELGVPIVPHVVIYLILLGTAAGMIGGGEDYGALAKVVSILLAAHGGLLAVKPLDDDDDDTKKTEKISGGYEFVSALYSALLAFGVAPVVAMGYAALGCIPLFLSVVDLVAVDTLCGLSPGGWMVVLVVFIGASAYGMLT